MWSWAAAADSLPERAWPRVAQGISDTSVPFQPGLDESEFELVCLNGGRRPLSDYQSCNWGRIPSHAVLTTSAKTTDLRRKYQRFLQVYTGLSGLGAAIEKPLGVVSACGDERIEFIRII